MGNYITKHFKKTLIVCIAAILMIVLAFQVIVTRAATTDNVYRLYNGRDHFYTTSPSEKNSAAASGYVYEGIGWIRSTDPTIYRLYNDIEHFYTASISERDSAQAVGYRYEGIGWTDSYPNGATIYRLYNGIEHFYTASIEEGKNALAIGYKYEGVAWGHEIINLTISDPSPTLIKTYDGNTDVAFTTGELDGVVAGDDVSVSAVGYYDSATIGTGKTITIDYTLSGADAANYTIDSYTNSNGEITGITTVSGYDDAVVLKMNGGDAIDNGTFTPVLGANAYRNFPAYYGVHAVTTANSPTESNQWKIVIHKADTTLAASMTNVVEKGWYDAVEGKVEDSAYLESVDSGDIVYTGNSNWNTMAGDDFSNVDEISFFSTAPLGEYTVSRTLYACDQTLGEADSDPTACPDAVAISNTFTQTITLANAITIGSANTEILTMNNGDVVEEFAPVIGDNFIRGEIAYYGIQATSAVASADNQWVTVIHKDDTSLTTDMIDLVAAGWYDEWDNTIPEPPSKYAEFEGSGDNTDDLVYYGNNGWDLAVGDVFNNVDGIVFSGTAPLGSYTITRTLYNPNGWLPISNSYVVKTINLTDNSSKEITAFTVDSQVGDTVIDESAKTITIHVPFGTDISGLSTSIEASPLAIVSPSSGDSVDFTSPVDYKVTANDLTHVHYTVTIEKLPGFGDHYGNWSDKSDSALTGETTTIAFVIRDDKVVDHAEISFDAGVTYVPMTEAEYSIEMGKNNRKGYEYDYAVSDSSDADVNYIVKGFDTEGNYATWPDSIDVSWYVDPLTDVDVSLTPGSVIFGYTFESEEGPVSYGAAKLAPYYLDVDASTVTLWGEKGESTAAVPLGDLAITDEGTISYANLAEVKADFPDLNFVPVAVAIYLEGANDLSSGSPWTYSYTVTLDATEVAIMAPPKLIDLAHDEDAMTITLTYSEPIHFETEHGDVATPVSPDILNIFVSTGGDYGLNTIAPDVNITDASFNGDNTVLTVTYTGNLEKMVDTDYVVDSWVADVLLPGDGGYDIKDVIGNTDIEGFPSVFTVSPIAPLLSSVAHDETARTITLTYTEPIQFTSEWGDAVVAPEDIRDALSIFVATPDGEDGWNYYVGNTDRVPFEADTRAPGVAIINAEFDVTGKILTVSYAGNLLADGSTYYLVDSWVPNGGIPGNGGYDIKDLAGNDYEDSISPAFVIGEVGPA